MSRGPAFGRGQRIAAVATRAVRYRRMRRLLLGCLAATWLAMTSSARGGGASRLVLDRADLEPTSIPNVSRLRLLVTTLDPTRNAGPLQIDGDKAWALKISGGDHHLPYAAGFYDGTQLATALVILVETTNDFDADLQTIKTSLDSQVLATLPSNTQVAVIGYAETTPAIKLGPIKAAQGKLGALAISASDAAPSLIRAVDRGIAALKKAKADPEGAPIRKILLIIGDGRDAEDDHAKITALGKKALKAGIRIDAVAYVPNLNFKPDPNNPKDKDKFAGSKGPLLNLGELSKQSQGAFRFVELGGEQGFNAAFERVHDEINRQYVLTFLVAPEEVTGKRVILATTKPALISNDVIVPAQPMCGGKECPTDGYCAADRCVQPRVEESRGILGWILLVIGGGVLLLGGATVAGVLIARRKKPKGPSFDAFMANAANVVEQAGAAPATAGMPAAAPAPAPAAPAVQAPIYGPQLFLMSGPNAGQRIALRHGFTMGKAPGSDLMLDQDSFASTNHAHILMDAAGNCTLVDKGSTNGTFVNGVRVSEYALTHGVAIRVGSTDVRFLAQ